MFSRNVGFSTRFRHSTLALDLSGGTLVLVGSRCHTLGEELRFGVCCPFGLPKKIGELLGEVGCAWSFLLVGYIANIRFHSQIKKLNAVFFI